MLRRLAFSTVPFLVLLAGCIPDRDNGDDPANRPDARLSVIQYRDPATGRCSAPFDEAIEWPTTGATFRGGCLALDARSSTDPQGQAPETLGYVFGTLGSGGTFNAFVTEPGDVTLVAGSRVALLSTGFQRTFALRASTDFAVEVTDSSGARDVGSAPFVFLNRAPSAIAPPNIVLPLGGYPHTPGVDFIVEFFGNGFDPDGDLLTYCWSFAGAAEICHDDPRHADFRVPVSPDSIGRFVARLVVKDGDGEAPSLPAHAVVSVVPRAAYIANGIETGGARLHRIDTSGSFQAIDGTVAALASIGGTPERVAGILRKNPFLMGFAPLPNGLNLSVRPADDPDAWGPATLIAGGLATSFVSVVGSGDGTGLLSTHFVAGGEAFLSRWNVDPAGNVTADWELSLGNGSSSFVLLHDDRGQAWVLSEIGGAILAVRDGGVAAEVVVEEIDPGWETLSAAVRPAEPGAPGEVWISRRPVSAQPAEPAHLRIYSSETLTFTDIAFGDEAPIGMAFWTRDLAWIASGDGTLALTDVELLRSGGGPAAILVRTGSITDVEDLIVDAATGSCIGRARDLDSGVVVYFESRLDGTFRTLDAPNWHPRLIAPNGHVAFSNDASIGIIGGFVGETSPEEGSHPSTFVAGAISDVDDKTGGLWSVETNELGTQSVLVRLAPEGEVLERLAGGVDATGPRLFDPAGMVTVPGGDGAWMRGYDPDLPGSFLEYLDLTVRPVAITRVATLNSAGDFTFPIAPAPPMPGQPSVVWTYEGGSFRRIDATGAKSIPYTLVPEERGGGPNNSPPPRFSGSRGADALCVVSYDPLGGLHYRRVRSDGQVTNYPAPVPAATLFLFDWIGVHASSDGEEACWFAYAEQDPGPDWTIDIKKFAADDGALLHSHREPNFSDKGNGPPLATGADTFWLTISFEQAVRIRFPAGVTTNGLSDFFFFDPTGTTLVGPGGR